ncbi:putative short-chain dehydrogenases/reductase [Aspergillus campestris IBT 28561]|uniref:Short-chain dehydrogenases/reductase n=1 Tax=Aspergillus campestris (strain IBT 28561) TaxID=1392248 RepID=A0A2I1CXG7_ASPC2|nr:putative short-chain dehydrogenases/reductase [Aspergillus campestris IBT 28561]PKY02310.1 putative short-chain dehydrogenases/reductase [Aspergillus campestris IBT 28561]
MATINQARQSNASLNDYRPDYVAVFVGATSGIGEATTRELATVVKKPTIYLIGRNETTGSKIIDELKASNPEGSFHFIQSDVSLLSNVDEACSKIKAHEKAVDLLFLSTGHLHMSKEDTKEGLENNHALRFYSRMRFIHNLLPLLSASTAPARVVSVLGPGTEGQVDEANFDLKKSWSFLSSAKYAATMNSLAMEHLAAQHPSISFVHVFPGIVHTALLNKSVGGIVAPVMKFFSRPFSLTAEQSGVWNTFILTSAAYPPAQPRDGGRVGAPLVEGIKTASASTGKIGGGSYLVNYNGADKTQTKLMADYRARGFPQKVWEHTLETFQRVLDPASA